MFCSACANFYTSTDSLPCYTSEQLFYEPRWLFTSHWSSIANLTMSLPKEPQHWTRPGFLISTDRSLLSLKSINNAFDKEFVYWTQAHPEDVLQAMLDGSCCLGVYKVSGDKAESTDDNSSLEQIGFARIITDNVTFAYLTDVYVLPANQGCGLGSWLIDCIGELFKPLPYLRRIMLLTGNAKTQASYEKRLGMSVMGDMDVTKGSVAMQWKGERSY